MTIRFRQKEIRIQPLLNFCVLAIISLYLLVTSICSIVAQITLLVDHPPVQKENGCNGHPALCDRPWSNITHIGAHDSAFVGIMPFENQNVDVTTQLDAGIRFLQLQTHRNHFGQLALCHTHCIMEDAGLLSAYLSTVGEWLDSHPHEVVTLLLTNNDRLNMSTYDAAYTAAGMQKHVFHPSNVTSFWISPTSWPTLGELIGNGTRLISFMDYGADPAHVPYILPEFSFFWETPFDVTSWSDFDSCDINRPDALLKSYKATTSADPSSPAFKTAQQQRQQFMYIVNHFLDTKLWGGIMVPDRKDVAKTNAMRGEGSVGAQVQLCSDTWGERPWGVLVDYFEKGQVVKLQNQLNGVD